MRDKFKKYAEELCTNSNCLNIFQDLKNIMCENGLYHEEGACLEKIFHITKEPKLYEKIGDIFLNKLRNRDVANAAYNKYLYYSDSKFYEKWAENLKSIGCNYVDTDNEENPSEVQSLSDKFDAIAYMMICLEKNSEYDGIAELICYADKLREQIKIYQKIYAEENYWSDYKDTCNHLSEVLSGVNNRNDINKFAISLNPSNKRAYIKIMDDYVTYKNYSESLNFYNTEFCKKFECSPNISIVNLCWLISDFYRDCYEFYDAVRFQKYALEYELKENCGV